MICENIPIICIYLLNIIVWSQCTNNHRTTNNYLFSFVYDEAFKYYLGVLGTYAHFILFKRYSDRRYTIYKLQNVSYNISSARSTPAPHPHTHVSVAHFFFFCSCVEHKHNTLKCIYVLRAGHLYITR